jgi:hypothetical protein
MIFWLSFRGRAWQSLLLGRGGGSFGESGVRSS